MAIPYAKFEMKGVGKDAPIVTGANGGKQSKCLYAFHLIDEEAICNLAHTLSKGAEKYEPHNWRKIPPEEHYSHMLTHWYAFLAGDTTDSNHLGHFLCRALFAYCTARDEIGKKPHQEQTREKTLAIIAEGIKQREATVNANLLE